jgi:hypothetical protein
MVNSRTIIFPFGIFLLCTVIFSGGGAAASGWYFYVSSKKEIAEAERFTQNSLIPILDACVQLAELDGGKDSSARLSELFRDYKSGNVVYKAFFAAENGKILAHCDQNEVSELKGNIASDEFSYNLDQIFSPIRKNMKEPYFDDYNLIGKTIPFSRDRVALLRKHVYPGIDRNGWIVSRQVVHKGRNVGVIAFLCDKEVIYDRITYNTKEGVFWAKMAGLAGAGLALIFSMIVFVRYQMIYSRAFSGAESSVCADAVCEFPALKEDYTAEEADPGVELVQLRDENPEPFYTEYEVHTRAYTDFKAPVQDAIPVVKK